jgi:hypothetical protein
MVGSPFDRMFVAGAGGQFFCLLSRDEAWRSTISYAEQRILVQNNVGRVSEA